MSDSLSCAAGSAEERVAAVVDEFMARAGRGERPDVDEYVRRHPELADVLRQVLPAVQLIRQDGASGPRPAEGPDAPLVGGTLGDFRIVREVGRGGMGVVYEAEQVSLRRRVALKVLPLAGMLDPRHLQRFRNEAQAAACLHHTNIVPVYFVGEERGVHFYAMQFIDGRPLSDLVRQLRQAEKNKPAGGARPEGAAASQDRTAAYQAVPGEGAAAGTTVRAAADDTPLTSEGRRGREYYRRVAELGAQAAEALDHAHQLGIVHRDVKPANLLLDAGGRLWVTDFGLAQVQHNDASLTLTGDLVGTLRYMSPEQALAKRVPIDHRTDVYSLGATLYELLTLRPVFRGNDRQELLRQIAFEEPVAPRRLEKAVPAELETIVLKALEKNPAERYGTAQELADDLRHWLEDRPIRARRPGLAQRAVKWSRRHRPLVAAAVVSLLLAVIMLAASNFVIWREKEETKRALWKAQLHQGEVDALVRQRYELNAKLERSLGVMERVLAALDEAPPGQVPEFERARLAVAAAALEFYTGLLPPESNDVPVQWERMWAYVRLGNLHVLRDAFAEAQRAYEEASAVAARVGRSSELSVAADKDLPGLEDHPAAETAYRRALAHWRKTSPQGLRAVADFRFALVSALPKHASAGPPSVSSRAPHRLPLPGAIVRKRISLLERVVADLPTPAHRSGLCLTCSAYAKELRLAGRNREAAEFYRRAIEHGERLQELPTDQRLEPFLRIFSDFQPAGPAGLEHLVSSCHAVGRYSAASAAALAGCGQGQDAGNLDEGERARLRKQARDWLNFDLRAWQRLLDKEPDKARPAVGLEMQHWLADPDFAGVRGEQALAKLPEAERGDWRMLWQEAEALRQRAAKPPHKEAAPRH